MAEHGELETFNIEKASSTASMLTLEQANDCTCRTQGCNPSTASLNDMGGVIPAYLALFLRFGRECSPSSWLLSPEGLMTGLVRPSPHLPSDRGETQHVMCDTCDMCLGP